MQPEICISRSAPLLEEGKAEDLTFSPISSFALQTGQIRGAPGIPSPLGLRLRFFRLKAGTERFLGAKKNKLKPNHRRNKPIRIIINI
jgi:hypothetical protein